MIKLTSETRAREECGSNENTDLRYLVNAFLTPNFDGYTVAIHTYYVV